ncbi:hypothetical protein PPERSA_03997 [Pseudocohnilembus persalinus]|uniref:Fungal lipase-type domain-containing protein n=1 Tax=Pseudocohnilembus persalinus TaxID=266149 RepID=A0A0V0QBQ8_PSEPJ|nr:hypothetical protein PPERSA_03997 [Pseudocohnilembus persalinus]|eukprot:KRW99527.1 hypothetical protein PPERSA_03997 [Pseudocohnilembus persalinus]
MSKLLIAFLLLSVIACQMQDFYSPQTSKSMLYYAKASYCEADQIKNWNGQACDFHPSMTDIKVVKNLAHGSQLYLGFDADANAIVIAFRGSQNIQNWIDNLDYKKTEYDFCNDCMVHKGFYKAWQAVSDEVMSTYRSLKSSHSGAKTYVTGHSLGGAIATLCALELRQAGFQVDNFYVFGCPRVGNQQFAEYGAQQLPYEVEVVHYKDPVPHVPLSVQGFVRIPTETYYYSKTDVNAYKWCPSAGGEENSKCSNKLLLATNIGDHLNYLGVYTGCTDIQDIQDEIAVLTYDNLPNNGLKRLARLEQQYLDEQQDQQRVISE